MEISFFLSCIFISLYFGYGIRFTACLALLLYVCLFKGKISVRKAVVLFLYTFILVISAGRVLDLNTLSFGFGQTSITRITGYAVNDSTAARYNSSRVTVSLRECNTGYGAVASARGNISVTVKGGADILAGDLVSFDGKIGSYGFSARSCFVRKRPAYNMARYKLLCQMKSRIGEGSDENILSLMLLLGISPDPEYRLSKLARESGTSFVLALSGMHIGLFSMLLGFLLKPVFGRRGGRLVSLVLLSFYVAIIGPKPSLVRALLLSLMFFCFPSLNGVSNLALTFLLQLILFPASAISLSAVFSYLSLAGILGFLPCMSAALDRIVVLPRFTSALLVSVSAVLYTVPFTYMVFGEYQLSSIATSSVISFLIYIYMLLAITSIFAPFVQPFRDMVYFLIFRLMQLGASVPMQQTLLPYILFLFSVLSVLLLSCILRDRRRRCGSLTMTVPRR